MKHSHTVLRQSTFIEKLAASIAMIAILTLSIPFQAFAQVSPDASQPTEVVAPEPAAPVVDEPVVSTADVTADTQTQPIVSEADDTQEINVLNTCDPTSSKDCPIEQPKTCILHSDTSTIFTGTATPAVPVNPIHAAWTALTNGAIWIWGQNPIADAENATEGTFTKTFYLTNIPTSGTLEIAADNTYEVTLNGNPLATDTSGDNFSANDVVVIPVGNLVIGANTLTFTVHNLAQSGGTMASNPAGLLYTVTLNGANCTSTPPPPPIPTVSIVATKVVCDAESYLPNWGLGGHGPIGPTTATDFVNQSEGHCHLQSGWEFEWGNSSAGDSGDTATGHFPGYNTFGPTNGSGVASVNIPVDSKSSEFHLREVLQAGYVPFTHAATPDNSNNVSAEFYCANDALNYDNWDFLRDARVGPTYYCVGFNAPTRPQPPQTSTVTLCKMDDQEHSLPGWTLMLKGAHVGTVAVKPDGTDYSVSGSPVATGNYVVTASGAYIYRPGEANASTSDAAYSLRAPSDSVYGGPYAPWVSENSFPTPYTGWLGVMLNHSLTNWGTVFHSNHAYALNLALLAPQNLTFTILDDQYADNSGSIEVNVDQGYGGVTGENGCTTFTGVPYGSYTTDELNQPGWTNFSGLGTVTVDSPEETFSVVNKQTPVENPKGTLTIVKKTTGGDGTFDFTVSPNTDLPSQHVTVTTTEGMGDEAVTLAEGSYNVTENLPEGWTYDSVNCVYEGETFGQVIEFGEHITIKNGDDVTCTFKNHKNSGGGETTSAHTTTVTGNTSAGENILGWMFNRDISTQSPFVFNTTSPDIGTGSLFVQPITNTINGGNDKFIGELFLQTPLPSVKSISYDFNIAAPDATAKNQFYMNVYTTFGDSSPTKLYDCRYDVVPTVGTLGGFTTVTFDPTLSYPVTTSGSSPHAPCPSSPAGMDALDGAGTPSIRAIAINTGDQSTGDTGVSGYYDKVVTVIKTGSDTHTETYDFEPTAIIPTEPPTGGGGGGGSRSSRSRGGSVLGTSTTTEPVGQVLGNSCGILIPNYLKIGWVNNITEVKDLQTFLNAEMALTLPVTGFFGKLTDHAVRLFQGKYGSDVLKPWVGLPASGIANPADTTGYVYKSTQWKINMIHCPELNLPFPVLD